MTESSTVDSVPLICVTCLVSVPPKYLLYYRGFLSLYVPIVCIWLAAYLHEAPKFFSFLSNWSTIFAGIYAILLFIYNILSIKHINQIFEKIRDRSPSDTNSTNNSHTNFIKHITSLAVHYRQNGGLPIQFEDRATIIIRNKWEINLILFEKIVIVAQALTLTLLLMVVLTYWITSASVSSFQFLNLQYHGFTFILLLIDYLITCNPGKQKHCLFSYAVCFIYWTFSIITYFTADKDYEYRQIYSFISFSVWYYFVIVYLGSLLGAAFCHRFLIWSKEKVFKRQLEKLGIGSENTINTSNRNVIDTNSTINEKNASNPHIDNRQDMEEIDAGSSNFSEDNIATFDAISDVEDADNSNINSKNNREEEEEEEDTNNVDTGVINSDDGNESDNNNIDDKNIGVVFSKKEDLSKIANLNENMIKLNGDTSVTITATATATQSSGLNGLNGLSAGFGKTKIDGNKSEDVIVSVETFSNMEDYGVGNPIND